MGRGMGSSGIPGQPAPASLKPQRASPPARAVLGIPGQPAPASLKHSGPHQAKSTLAANTGAACPGLIEADGFRLDAPIIGRIPGQPAPASLKPAASPVHDPAPRRRIPGQPAPASLKQQTRAGRMPPEDLNTGAACPGLIEATP